MGPRGRNFLAVGRVGVGVGVGVGEGRGTPMGSRVELMLSISDELVGVRGRRRVGILSSWMVGLWRNGAGRGVRAGKPELGGDANPAIGPEGGSTRRTESLCGQLKYGDRRQMVLEIRCHASSS